MTRWPNLFVVGAPKAGSTSLYEYLADFSEIYMSPVKEPNFFSREIISDDNEIGPIRDQSRYLRLFEDSESFKYRGEASPTYLLDKKAPNLIRQVSPDARILIILRDPVDLAFSYYLMMFGRREIRLPFSEAVSHRLRYQPLDWSKRQLRLEFAFYAESLERYIETFGRQQVHVILFEEMTSDPQQQIDNIAKFLDCSSPVINGSPVHYNKASVARSQVALSLLRNRPLIQFAEKLTSRKFRHFVREHFLMKPVKKPEVENIARKILTELYSDDVAKVQRIICRPLPWANFYTADKGTSEQA